MASFLPSLNDDLIDFIREQKIFFTATAPSDGRINLSPKGMDTFRCLDYSRVAYLDLTGSGNETSAHLMENGRITVMFCSFTAKPLILRLYGAGRVVLPRDPHWEGLFPLFDACPGARQIIEIRIDSVQTSCGYAVPVYALVEERQSLVKWADHKGKEGLTAYWKEKNRISIDGLPTHPLVEDVL
jgi:hypothetical protein